MLSDKQMEKTITITETELETLKALVENFYAIKNIRAWAAEENLETKLALRARLTALESK